MKTAAVYDRWLATLGGGEQVAFAYAEGLRDLGFQTVMLTHSEIDRAKAEGKMGVNLDEVEIIVLPMMSSQELSEYTERYDVFINTSYLDYFPNRSKRGILSIFFPSQIFLTPYEYIKRTIVLPSFSHFFIYPSLFEGFRFDEYMHKRIYKWLGKRSSIIFNKNVGSFSIELFCRTLAISLVDQITFELEGKKVTPRRKHIYDVDNIVEYWFEIPNSANKRFTIVLPESEYSRDVALVRLTIKSIRYVLYNIFKRYFPKWEMRLHGGPGVTKLSDLTSYQRILTISDYSKAWIKKYWGLTAEVLYPPVNVKNFKAATRKKNWILHVGRFFVTGHNKKQLDLIKVFRKLVDEKGLKGWELHFVGSVADGEQHLEYFEQCKYYATGYLVFFHTDVPFSQLQQILSEGKIYWHATGLDENENKSPILFEHFGITTVEAMASGCVPVVIKAGGQKEIVIVGSGYLWKNREQLIAQTYELTQDPQLLSSMSEQAIRRAKYFDRSEFKKRFEKYIS
ncbi:MAG: glycosyltransferase [Candidatus Woesebacteria bacterium]